MSSFLDKLLGRSLEQLALGPDRDAFLDRLGRADIQIIAACDSEGLDPNTTTQEELLAAIEQAAKAFADAEHFQPFVYERDGVIRLPFFTSQRAANTFAGEYCRERNRMLPIQLLSVKGTLLGQLVTACDVLVMNDRSRGEFPIPEADAESIYRLWGEEEPAPDSNP